MHHVHAGISGDGPSIAPARTHPLDPLDPDELARAVRIVRESEAHDPSALFVSVATAEPAKDDVLAEHDRIERIALVVIWRQRSRELVEIVVSLDGEELLVSRVVEGARAPMIAHQVEGALRVARSSDEYLDRLRRRVPEKFDDAELYLEAWPFGGLLPDRFAGRRVVYTPAWLRKHPDGNQYAHPIHGCFAVIDLDTLELLEIEEHDDIAVPSADGDYRTTAQLGRALPRLEIVQPDGPGFAIDGHEVSWRDWRMRIGFCPREGLVLHDVRFVDQGRERRIAYRLSLAELVIPYADPSPGSYRKNAFDTGEVFMGMRSNSLQHGCDCIGATAYLDASYVDSVGDVKTIDDAICLHEEDSGILWKHTDSDGHVEVRRGRRFVVSSIYTVDNYEYGYYWYFGLDGSIEFEVKFTGIVLTIAGEPSADAPFATEVSPGLLAPHHQHILCARLDLDIDGVENTVTEVDAVAPPRGPMNPYGGSFVEKQHVVGDESESRRFTDPARARYWKVGNPRARNAMGRPAAYRLLPKSPVMPLAEPDSSIGRRAEFMYADLWVTAYDDAQRYPAGEYPFQGAGGDGLPEWVSERRALVSTDVVLWHVFGITHVPRLEDWPIMPVERAGFVLAPFGFFDRNPTLDLPRTPDHCLTPSEDSQRGSRL